MRSLTSFASGFVLSYLYFSLLLIPSAEAKINIPRQVSTAISVNGQVNSFQTVLLPAIRTLVAAPLKMLHQLYLEVRAFLATHNFRQMLDMSMISQLVNVVPKRVNEYWTTFREVETACLKRTFCDLADHTSTRVPHWFNQILTIYFTTFSHNSVYYQSVLNGLVSHNCPAVYPDCDPSAFMTRLTGNMSQSLSATITPIRDAFSNLMAVTVSTLDTMASGGMSNFLTPRPSMLTADPSSASSDNNLDEDNRGDFRNNQGRRPSSRPLNNNKNEEETFGQNHFETIGERNRQPIIDRIDRVPHSGPAPFHARQ